MLLSIKIDNVYEDGETISKTLIDVEVPDPPTEPEPHEDWAYDHLFTLTGTGRTHGDAGYFVEIIAAGHPALVGRTYEWGI